MHLEDCKTRCSWSLGHPLLTSYHDEEWGVPEYDDRKIFELLTLEGAQAGLSWLTILKKREGYRRAFDGFDPEVIARYDEQKVAELREDAGIIRNRLKIRSTIGNAQAYLKLRESEGSFSGYLWNFVDGQPIVNRWSDASQMPAETVESQRISKALKKLGFRFVGPTIIYSFMQAIGMVDDHVKGCWKCS